MKLEKFLFLQTLNINYHQTVLPIEAALLKFTIKFLRNEESRRDD